MSRPLRRPRPTLWPRVWAGAALLALGSLAIWWAGGASVASSGLVWQFAAGG